MKRRVLTFSRHLLSVRVAALPPTVMQLQGLDQEDAWTTFLRSRLVSTDNVSLQSERGTVTCARATLEGELAVAKRAVCELARRRNALIPVSILPSDVLALIFEICIEAGIPERETSSWGIKPDRSIPTCLELSHVCNVWRSTVLGYPTLWRRIPFSVKDLLLETWLSHTKTAPLVLRYIHAGSSPPYVQKRDYAGLLRELMSHFPSPIVDLLQCLSSAQRLMLLHLSWCFPLSPDTSEADYPTVELRQLTNFELESSSRACETVWHALKMPITTRVKINTGTLECPIFSSNVSRFIPLILPRLRPISETDSRRIRYLSVTDRPSFILQASVGAAPLWLLEPTEHPQCDVKLNDLVTRLLASDFISLLQGFPCDFLCRLDIVSSVIVPPEVWRTLLLGAQQLETIFIAGPIAAGFCKALHFPEDPLLPSLRTLGLRDMPLHVLYQGQPLHKVLLDILVHRQRAGVGITFLSLEDCSAQMDWVDLYCKIEGLQVDWNEHESELDTDFDDDEEE
ncbi:hypothetical protein K488DRAFT_68518 [Vararia minispora EC-137]|uniref:Uncharacterized protein n=1 Tax=Vararia minispora EC-137 TaxID=1314806 RepID=A0ACB8QU41_9AGAM|nr:hypothetical protein K488DRAFT_68518 [Vararia minispora EC-137]